MISYDVISHDKITHDKRSYDEDQDEDQKVFVRKVEDGRNTLFPRNVWGPLGCYLLSSLVPKSRFRGSGKIIFFKKSFEVKKRCRIIP